MVNGVQTSKHENGLSAKGEASHFEEIIQLSNHNNEREKSEIDRPDEPIMAFESGESFLKKTGPIKPQHVAGEHLKSSSWAALWYDKFEGICIFFREVDNRQVHLNSSCCV